MSLENCRVVLVRPQIARNIGATARAMRNMGMKELVLVTPCANHLDPAAVRLSTHGKAILRNARIATDIASAIDDCHFVVGTSGIRGGQFRRQSVSTPETLMPVLAESLTKTRVAVLFGTERTGLTNTEVQDCHYLLNLDAEPEYPALNLAQAVAITLYEIRKAFRHRSATSAAHAESSAGKSQAAKSDPANYQTQEAMFTALEDALTKIGFLYGKRKEALMHGIRHLFARSKLTQRDVLWLLGFSRQVRWFTDSKNGTASE